MFRILILCLFIGFQFNLKAQFKITGEVTDTTNEALSFASVVILSQLDSTIITYGLTNGNGEYQLDIESKGDYLMQYTFLGYQTIIKYLDTDWTKNKIKLSPIQMKIANIQLDEVNIEADRIPMKMKGDTLVYDAKAFKIKAGDDAEALIEKLPGIQVDQDGKITAQGKEVKKILVNGKEFFSNDPKVATKNLDAEAIDKVEVLDKKSENAEFTGVDDGEEEKAINIVLKEEYNKGSFGKAYGAVGTEETYKGKLNFNRFNKKTQSSIIANGNNLNQQAFSFSEYQDFNPSGGYNYNAINGIGGNEGINNSFSGGANINHEFSKKLEISGNYFFIRNENKLKKEVNSTNFSPTETFEKNQEVRKTDLQQTNSATIDLEWKPDSMTRVDVDGNVYFANQDFTNKLVTLFSSDSSLENVTTNKLKTNIDKWSTYLNFSYKRKLKKKGRNFQISSDYYHGLDQTQNDLINSTQGNSLNQFQNFEENFDRHRSNVEYTEPIAKNWYLTGKYSLNAEANSPERQFYNRMNGSSSLDTNLSGTFERTTLENKATAYLKRNTKKSTFGIGSSVSNINLRANTINRNFQYLNPYTWIRFKLKGSQNLRFSYQTGVSLPSLTQLLSIPNNVNPNQNYVGNPDLTPEYYHRIFMNYFLFNPINFTNYYFYLNFTKTNNKIINQTIVLPDLTTEVSPVNTSLSESYSAYGSIAQPIKKINLKYRAYGSATYNKFNAFLNGKSTLSGRQNFSIGGNIGRNKKEKWNLSVGASISFNYQTYEINPDFNQKFNNYDWYANGELSISKTLELSAKYTVRRYAAVSFADAQVLHFINASLRKSFKDDIWAISIIANDILNQNRGISRSGDVNSLQEENYNSRAQYFMLAIERKFGKRKENDSKTRMFMH